MKAERIEDLGRIREMLDRILSDCGDLQSMCMGKHTKPRFVETYSGERLEDLHDELRWMFDKLQNVLNLAVGDDELD